jgi:hypothetical protein
MFFTDKNRKKNLILSLVALFIFSGAVFFTQLNTVQAEGMGIATPGGLITFSGIGDSISEAFKLLLYGVFVMFGWIASLAVTIFEWAIDPKDVTVLFNNSGVLESWKFVRDFFNLFFILVLLYIAFTVVFQVQKNFKQALLSLILAALFVNFSYPISRALIDATNVPMYFFSNQIMGRDADKGTGVLGATMTASRIEGILIPGSEVGMGEVNFEKTSVSRLLMAIVFIFIFSVTLLVLSIMFVIRLVALVVLVIFSSVGFVASIIPGMGQYSKMWWDNFWKYAIFGPAAMLMLLIASHFFSALGNGSELMESMKKVAGNNVMGDDVKFYSSMALFSIPIIMLWMAMGLAQKMSIAGASSVVGLGEKFTKWVGKAPFRAGWAGAKFAGRKAESKLSKGKYTKYLSPTVLKEAFKARSEAQRHEDMLPVEMAKAQMHNDLNKIVSKIPVVNKLSHKDNTDYAFLKQNEQKAHYEAQLKERGGGEMTEDSTRRFLKEAMDEHNSAKALAAMTALSRMNGLDDIAGDFAVQMKVKGSQDQVKIVEDYNDTMRAMMDKLGIDEQSAMKHMHNFGENAKSKGDNAFGDHYRVNVDNGEWEENPDYAGDVGGNFKKMKAQTRQDVMHSRALFEQHGAPVLDPAT